MDTVGDLLIRIRNASLARHQELEAPWSRMGENVCRLLAEGGYLVQVVVKAAETRGGSRVKRLALKLAYNRDGLPMVTELKRVSKPGRRRYLRSGSLPYVLQGKGMAVVSTSQGLMTADEARKKKLGGEIICVVW